MKKVERKMVERNARLNTENALIVFCKNPIIGRAKTRIAKDAGELEAHKIYKQLLSICRSNLSPLSIPIYVFYDLYIHGMDEWKTANYIKRIQSGGDLGTRMKNAFQSVLANHKNVVIIGTDCPDLDSRLIEQAFTSLEKHDLVVGPSLDGGYYLLGMSRLHSSLFEGVAWSTDTVLTKTKALAQDLGLSIDHLKPLNDIDHLADWEVYQRR